jgi:pseudoazurin
MRVIKTLETIIAASMFLGIAVAADAKEYKVAMLNTGPDGAMTFSPAYLKIAPDDDILFVAQDKGHDAQSIAGLTPAGAAPFTGAMSQDVKVKFTKPGLYGYECAPHFAMGMVGLVQVGAVANKAQFQAGIAKLPPMARIRMTKYFAEAR